MIRRLPGMTDADYIAAVDAAAPPLAEEQRTRLAALLGREHGAPIARLPAHPSSAEIDLMEVSA